MDATRFEGGFTNAPVDSAHAFRAALSALSRPGRVEVLDRARPPAPLSVAAGTLILTLCDAETPVHLAGVHDCAAVRDWITFHSSAPFAGAAEAMFAIGAWDALLPLSTYATGTPDYPDRAATLIVETEGVALAPMILSGPGIRTTATADLPAALLTARERAGFPLGLDFFFTHGTAVCALPRTTRLEAA
jgi:alpha-D-ribose 1-methylphosphonate 5-triphosphate synthase subunit PhnH